MRNVAGVLAAPTTATWIWRITTLLYLVVTTFRSSTFGEVLPGSILQAAQFGVVVAGLLVGVFAKPKIGIDGVTHKLFYGSMALFMLVALGSILISVDPMASASQWLISLVMLSFVVWNAASRWRVDRILVRADLKFLALFWSTIQIIGLVLLLVAPEHALGYFMRFTGLFSNANYTGMVSAATLVLLLGLARSSKARRAFAYYGALSIPVLAALILSGSRGSLIACVIGLAILLAAMATRASLKVLVGVVAMIVILGTLLVPAQEIRDQQAGLPGPTGPTGSSSSVERPTDAYDLVESKTSGRLGIYRQALKAWADSPVLGVGYRAAPEVTGGMETHNLPLQILLETGILGLLTWLGMIVALSMRLRREKVDTAVIAVLATVITLELAESSMLGWGGPTAFYFWTIFVAALYSPNWHKTLSADNNLISSEQSEGLTNTEDRPQS